MRGALIVLSVLLGCGCGSGSTLAADDGGLDGGAGLDAAGVDASSPIDGAAPDAGVDAAACVRANKPAVLCVDDSDCPPQQPQNIEKFCCAVVSVFPGMCKSPSFQRSECQLGGCGGTLNCDATMGGGVGLQHVCTSPSDCARTQNSCCSMCKDGVSLAVCMSPDDALGIGAQCM